jgi:glycosyltransferase involved in cell wall biosynthesis
MEHSKKNIRLLICTGSRSIHGGVENIISDLSRNLSPFSIDVIVGLCKGAKYNDPDRYRQAFQDLVTIDINGTKGTRQSRIEALIRTFKEVNPDIVLIARVAEAYEALRRLKKNKNSPRLAVTIQAYEPHYIYDAFVYRHWIDLIVTSGELIRLALIRWAGVEGDRVVNIPGGVHPPLTRVTPRSATCPIRIGYVGRLDSGQKRILDLVPFVKKLIELEIDFTLDIVGTGPAEDELKKSMSSFINKREIVFHGWQNHEILYENIYPQMDIFVHFAHTEGVTIAPREGMAHGVVPVVSEFIGLKAEKQFLHEVNALTFPVGDTETSAQNVFRLVNESGLLERLSFAAMRSQTGKYSYWGAIEAWADAFKLCLEKPARNNTNLKITFPPDGRLERAGIRPWVAQRIRDLLGKRHIHADGGGEWPTGSGLMSEEKKCAIMDLVAELDKKNQVINGNLH